MSTSLELREQIAAAERALEDKRQAAAQLDERIEQAVERQRLRRELESILGSVSLQEYYINTKHSKIRCIDQDMCGPHMPGDEVVLGAIRRQDNWQDTISRGVGEEAVDCGAVVVKGEFVWRIGGLSWLVNSLKQMNQDWVESEEFRVAEQTFRFVYHPHRGDFVHPQRGSLAMIHYSDGGLTFRYQILIKVAGGEFEQWGEMGDECHPDKDTCEMVFGPDVVRRPAKPAGIFGLSHEELLQSQWVEDDTLTAKFRLEVRPEIHWDIKPSIVSKTNIDVPPTTIRDNLLSLLEQGKGSDVTFMVQGEKLHAHSQILAARSELFDRQLNGGMRESVFKEIVVEDFDVTTFRVFLQFLYTDEFACIDDMVKQACARTSSSDINNVALASSSNMRIPFLQHVLAISHKYSVPRLRLWCEQQLCGCITVDDVCSVLCQAHLYEAKQLEEACLAFIREKMQQLVTTPMFGSLSKEWPEVMLKISIYTAGVSQTSAAAAIEAQQRVGEKRKRDEKTDWA